MGVRRLMAEMVGTDLENEALMNKMTELMGRSINLSPGADLEGIPHPPPPFHSHLV
jgi:hypothetical protein